MLNLRSQDLETIRAIDPGLKILHWNPDFESYLERGMLF